MRKLIFFSIAILSFPLFAANQCISGKPTSTNLIDQMKLAKENSPITKLIYAQYNFGSQNTEAKAAKYQCLACTAEEQQKRANSLAEVANSTNAIKPAPYLLFKSECLAKSGRFVASTKEVSCPSGAPASKLCLTENMLEYQNAVISNFAGCLAKSGFRTLDPVSLLKMYATESAFKPQYAYGGGVGVGQLTAIFVEDIHQKHRGFKYLNTIAKSPAKECDAAKIIAKADVSSKPSIANQCAFISVGTGLERNILYTLIGSVTAWEKDISPALQAYSAKYKNDPKLQEAENLALLNGYGSGGHVAARATIRQLSHLPPDKFIEAINRPMLTVRGKKTAINSYITRIYNRQKEIQGRKGPVEPQLIEEGVKKCIN